MRIALPLAGTFQFFEGYREEPMTLLQKLEQEYRAARRPALEKMAEIHGKRKELSEGETFLLAHPSLPGPELRTDQLSKDSSKVRRKRTDNRFSAVPLAP